MSYSNGARITPSRWLAILTLISIPLTFAEPPKALTDDGILKRDPTFIESGKALIYGYDEKKILSA